MKRVSIMMLCLATLTACGGVGTDMPSTPPGAVPAVSVVTPPSSPSSSSTTTNANGVIATKSTREYSGTVDVLFLNATNVRWNGSQFISDTVNVAPVNGVLSHYPQAKVEQGISGKTADQLLQSYRYMKEQGIKSAYDWNGYYKIYLTDETQATQMANDLKAISNLIESAQTKYKPIPLGNAQPTPDLTASQGYLKSFAQTGGLNITAMWAAPYSLSGQSVTISDEEDGAYLDHEDLVGQPIKQTQQYAYDDKNYTQHGTAVSGILAAKKDSKGVTGIVNTEKGLSIGLSYMPGNAAALAAYNSGAGPEPLSREGDVIITVVGSNGPNNVGLPYEWTDLEFKAIQQLTDMGVTVVEGVANSSVNFDDPQYSSLSVDSGAIFVGGSQGGNLVKADFSNCGKRVDVFAWGQGVLTSGYGDYGREPLLIVDNDYVDKTPLNVCFPASWWAVSGGFVSDANAQQVVKALCAKNSKYCPAGVVISMAPYKGGFCPADHTLVPTTLNGKAIQVADDGGQFFYDNDPTTPEWNVSGPTQWYTNFNGTSASTPIIGGGVVLLQEYVRKVWNADGTYKRVYLTSQQVREILKESGKGQGAKDTNNPSQPASCSIGVQPDFGKALQLIDQGWCPDKANNKCAIPQIKYFPPKPIGPSQSTAYDMDGDKRADLIAFSSDHKWTVDLSSIGANADHYGAWDITIALPATALSKDGMFFPVVADYNSDGQADLAIYDSVNGQWYIKYTTADVLAGKWGSGWDRIIDYSKVVGWKAYSRPAPGDYDGDGWMDIGLVTPNGHWLMDYGMFTITAVNADKAAIQWNKKDSWGNIDKDVPFLTAQQLQQAPGWAYAPVGAPYYADAKTTNIFYIIPDTLNNAGIVMGSAPPDFANTEAIEAGNGIEAGSLIAPLTIDIVWKLVGDDGANLPTFRNSTTGQWSLKWVEGIGWVQDTLNFGGITCRSIPADYDGDGFADRATLCDSGEFRIAYTGKKFSVNADGLRHIQEVSAQQPLPAFVYPGGVSFQDIKAIFETVMYLCPTVAPGPSGCTIDTMVPIPIGPYFPQCVDAVNKQYTSDPCASPLKKVDCEVKHIKQAQCVWQ